MRTILRLAALAIVAAAFAGCAADPSVYEAYNQAPRENGREVVQAGPAKPLECVPYAREHSAIKIRGNANTWWAQAASKYPRGSAPEVGSVMVLEGTTAGHVAVVKTLVSSREIRIDHANWLNDGSIYVNDPVMDVSQGNDWSAVRVFNIKTGGWGAKVYPVQGFIGSHQTSGSDLDTDEQAPARPDLVAQGGGGTVGRVAFVTDGTP